MPRKFIKRYLPDPHWIKKQQSLRFLGDWIHDPNIWHLTRYSVSKATFIGFFAAFIPFPAQMIIAAMLAVLFRANMVICICLVWITNPLTIAPMFYIAYKVGAAVLGTPVDSFHFEPSWGWLTHGLATVWQPFLLGCLLCGVFCGLMGTTLVRWLWRRHIMHRWHERQKLRKAETHKNDQ